MLLIEIGYVPYPDICFLLFEFAVLKGPPRCTYHLVFWTWQCSGVILLGGGRRGAFFAGAPPKIGFFQKRPPTQGFRAPPPPVPPHNQNFKNLAKKLFETSEKNQIFN